MNILFESWEATAKVIIGAVVMYLTFVVLVRVSGKRTLAKMNSFDFVVSIALGALIGVTTLGSAAILDGIIGLITIVALQYIFTSLAVKVAYFRHLIQGSAELMYYHNDFQTDNMKRHRITKRDIYEAIRKEGFDSLDEVEAVVLEDSGTFSVIERSESKNKNSLRFVKGLEGANSV